MLNFRALSIRRKQMLIIMLTSSVALLLACAAFVAYDVSRFRREMVESISSLAEVVGHSTTAAIDFKDPAAAAQTLGALRGEPSIVLAHVHALDGRNFATYVRAGAQPPPEIPYSLAARHEFTATHLHLFRPITQGGEQIGTIELIADLHELRERLWRYAGIAGLVLIASLLAAFGVSSRLQKLISDPILHLAQVARSVALEENYSVRATKQSEDELGQLVDGFNAMLGQIQQRDAALQAARAGLEARVIERTSELATVNEALQNEVGERERAQAFLNSVVANLPIPIFIKDARELRFILWNKAGEQLTGITHAEMIGKNDYDFFPKPDAERYVAHDRAAFEKRSVLEISEEIIQTRHQGARITHVRKVPIFDARGEPAYLLGISEDITERKQATEALHQSEERFRLLVEESPDVIGIYQDKKLVFINSTGTRVFGARTSAELLGHKPEQMIHPDDFAGAMDRIRRRLAGETGLYPAEVRYLTLAGTPVPMEVSAAPITFDGKPAVQFIARDITERKRLAEALAQERNLLRTVIDALPDFIYVKDCEHRFQLSNLANAHLLGIASPAQLVGKTDFDFFPPELAAEYLVTEQAVIKDGQPLIDVEERLFDQAGGERWQFTTQIPLRDLEGKVIGLVGVGHDITERKRADEALRESEERFSGAFDHAPIGIALVSPDGHWLQVNRAICDLVGYSEAELLTRTFQDITHPEDLETDLAYVRQMIEGEIRTYQMEKRYIHARGHFVTVLLIVSLVRDSQGQPRYFISQIQDITARKAAENALRESNEKFHQLANNITDAFWIRSADMNEVHYISPAFETIWGRSVESLYANPHQWPDFILAEDRERVLGAFATFKEDSPNLTLEYRIVRPGGEIRWVSLRAAQVRDAAGKVIRLTGIVTDITERKQVEAQLFQSQKMETVGKLAGGVAHEFNSILTAIIGQSELLLDDLPAGSPLAYNATEISKAAGRAATLTRQLLAYGRKQFLRPEALNLNQVISGMDGVVRHLMGAQTVDVRIIPARGLHLVKADAGQIEQVIMNLAINAREAMPNGGKLRMETANISFDQETASRYPELKPGNYAMLAITDTGAGMTEEIRTRAFEPFFTTKDVGQGPGLGLSTCYGIVKQSGGHISVYSEPGRGTTFKIYLPQVESPAKTSIPSGVAMDLPRGTETILLVEENPALREMAATLLKRLGYTVLAAANGIEALSLKQQADSGPIDLLFTDVTMPHMSGRELADRVLALSPHTRILFASSSTENAIVHPGALNPGVALLQKPFTPSALAHKLREVLEQESGRQGTSGSGIS